MHRFGWISDKGEPRPAWDLRSLGWHLCGLEHAGTGGALPILCDFAGTSPSRLSTYKGWRRQTILLGVDGSLERAGLLAADFADALPSDVDLRELAQRAARLISAGESLPRFRQAGPVQLDLFHRDGTVRGRWLGLHPREFALLWRLAEKPGARLSRRQLLADVWRLQHEPETNRVEVHVSRLRGKLATAGVQSFVATDPRGGYHLVL